MSASSAPNTPKGIPTITLKKVPPGTKKSKVKSTSASTGVKNGTVKSKKPIPTLTLKDDEVSRTSTESVLSQTEEPTVTKSLPTTTSEPTTFATSTRSTSTTASSTILVVSNTSVVKDVPTITAPAIFVDHSVNEKGEKMMTKPVVAGSLTASALVCIGMILAAWYFCAGGRNKVRKLKYNVFYFFKWRSWFFPKKEKIKKKRNIFSPSLNKKNYFHHGSDDSEKSRPHSASSADANEETLYHMDPTPPAPVHRKASVISHSSLQANPDLSHSSSVLGRFSFESASSSIARPEPAYMHSNASEYTIHTRTTSSISFRSRALSRATDGAAEVHNQTSDRDADFTTSDSFSEETNFRCLNVESRQTAFYSCNSTSEEIDGPCSRASFASSGVMPNFSVLPDRYDVSGLHMDSLSTVSPDTSREDSSIELERGRVIEEIEMSFVGNQTRVSIISHDGHSSAFI